MKKYKTALAKSDLSKLNDKDSISYQLLKWDIDTGLEGLNHTDHLLQLNQMNSLHLNRNQIAKTIIK